MNKYLLLLTMLYLPFVSIADSSERIQLKFNGEQLERDADISVLPGHPNVLSINYTTPQTSAAGGKVELIKTLPNGTVIRDAIILDEDGYAELQLGPMTAPPKYVFTAGTVYRVGYQITLTVKKAGSNKVLYHKGWSQGLAEKPAPWRIFPVRPAPIIRAGQERFVAGGEHRVPYNPKLAVEAALGLCLDESVLLDQDEVTALFRLNPGALVEQLDCRLRVFDSGGEALVDQPVRVECGESWRALTLDASSWPAGDYQIALYPEVDGRVWDEGPTLSYRRRFPDKNLVRVSPVAPWTLRRDFTREEIVITDFRQAIKKFNLAESQGWTTERVETGYALTTRSTRDDGVFELTLPLKGLYAVFAVPHAHGCYLRVGDDPLTRPVAGPLAGHENNGARAVTNRAEIFITIADLTSAPVRLLGPGDEADITGGLAGLRLTPVTRESVTAFRTVTTQLPVPLYGVNEHMDYFSPRRPLPTRGEHDQFDMMIAGQAEIGLNIDWTVGRSSVNYNSALPNHRDIFQLPAGFDPLSEAFRCREKFDVKIRAHYVVMYYGTLGIKSWNRAFNDNPQYRRWKKNATSADDGKSGGQLLSFYFPAIRRDKVDVLLEVAGLGADGVMVCTIRLPELMCHHPDMVAEYRNKFAVDPLQFDASNQEKYNHWITWRADFFTQLLRELRAGLQSLELEQSRRIPLAVRIPSAGLYWNLAQGMDVEQWLREGLADQLQVVPLETRGGSGCNSHDIRPYIDLGRRYGTPVSGGLGATWNRAPEAYPAAMRRALGLLRAGVTGMDIYESQQLARCSWHRWITPLFGHPELLEDFMDESNIEACHPITARTALYGYDNHARWFIEDGGIYVWDIYGFGPGSL